MEKLIDLWCGENPKDHTEVMEAGKRNSSREEETNSAVPGHTKLAEERISQTSHRESTSPEGSSSEVQKRILMKEPTIKYNIGGTAELGNFRDVVEFCHPLRPEIVRDRRFFVRIEVSGIPAVALVDSGASRTYVGPKFADRFGDQVFTS